MHFTCSNFNTIAEICDIHGNKTRDILDNSMSTTIQYLLNI
nr:unnamed protein product [Callosobruchus chinensis]